MDTADIRAIIDHIYKRQRIGHVRYQWLCIRQVAEKREQVFEIGTGYDTSILAIVRLLEVNDTGSLVSIDEYVG